MRYTFWLLMLALAGVGSAQWRHFGDAATGAGSAGAAMRSGASGSMAGDMVSAHNAVRARVMTAPLKWSDPLASVAQAWADNLMKSGQFVHSHNPKYGENLYEIEGGSATPAVVIDRWAAEVQDYDYGSNSCRGVCGHYTQLVWNDTKKVGCAMAGDATREVWVCEYEPPGNWVGRKPY